jgi:serine protease Do
MKSLFLSLAVAVALICASCSDKQPEITQPQAEEAMEGTHFSFAEVAAAVLPAVAEIRVAGGAGLGSGVLVARDGKQYFAVTNNHVVGESMEITVWTHDGVEHQGILSGSDPRLDIAVVSFEASEKEYPVASLGDSDLLQVGDWVLAAGNPFGFAFSITAGIVSATGRTGPGGNISDFIQTDASINQGNSGGPLVNIRGEIVGINTWITTDTGINVGLGFAMPINNVRKAISDIISGGQVRYGWLGVEIGDVREDEANALAFSQPTGVIVRGVFNDSPAEIGGIFPGDIVIKINDEPVHDYRHLSRIVGSIGAGEEAAFIVYRAGEETTLGIKMGLRGSEAEIEKAYYEMWPGFSVIHTDEIAEGMDEISVKGLMILDLFPNGMPKSAGMEDGDVILAINSNQVKNLMDFYRIMNDTEIKAFDFLLNRSGEEITIGLIKR